MIERKANIVDCLGTISASELKEIIFSLSVKCVLGICFNWLYFFPALWSSVFIFPGEMYSVCNKREPQSFIRWMLIKRSVQRSTWGVLDTPCCWILPKAPGGRYCYYPCFSQEETEAQRHSVTHPRAYGSHDETAIPMLTVCPLLSIKPRAHWRWLKGAAEDPWNSGLRLRPRKRRKCRVLG